MGRMKRFVALALAACAIAAPLKAEGGLSVLKTQHFAIIYPSESAESAAYLAERADGIADEVFAILGATLPRRLPVYLDPGTEVLNAYFSPFPYNRIVLYDTPPLDGSLGGYRDALLSVFRHELVHAVSMNIRTPFWRLVSAVVGDVVSIDSGITMTPSFIEGVTVSFESLSGDGRLNDPLTTHRFVQDKIEGRFLGWKEAAGARDIFPDGSVYYLYGGAFSAYLQRTYGMERYARLWKEGAKFNPFIGYLQLRFRRVYGMSIKDAWEDFRASVPVPAHVERAGSPLSLAREGIITALAGSARGVAWADENAGAVFFRSEDGAVRSLFAADGGVSRLSVSPSGRYLLVSDYHSAGDRVHQRVRVYDLDAGRFLDRELPPLRDAAFLGDDDTVCAVSTRSQWSSLVVLSLARPGETRVLYEAGPGKEFYGIFTPADAGRGRVACIAASGPNRRILVFDAASGSRSALSLPEGVAFPRYLHAAYTGDGIRVSLGWAGPNTLYRGATWAPEAGTLALQPADRSGGVFLPVAGAKPRTIRYVARFSDREDIREIAAASWETKPATLVPDAIRNSDEFAEGLSGPSRIAGSSAPTPPLTPISFHRLPYLREGLFLPLPIVLDVDTGLGQIAPGFLFLTSDPTERLSLSLMPAYVSSYTFVEFSAEVGYRASGNALSLSVKDHIDELFDRAYRDFSATLGATRTVTLGPEWRTLGLGASASFHGYANAEEGRPYQSLEDHSLVFSSDLLFLSLVEPRLRSRVLFPSSPHGFAVQAACSRIVLLPAQSASFATASLRVDPPVIPLTASVSVAWADGLRFGPDSAVIVSSAGLPWRAGVPRLVPAFPEYEVEGWDDTSATLVAGGAIEIEPVRVEIQRGVPVLPLYAKRFAVAVGYRAALFGPGSADQTYLDTAYVSAGFTANLLVGALTNVSVTGRAEYAYAIRAENPVILFSFLYSIGL